MTRPEFQEQPFVVRTSARPGILSVSIPPLIRSEFHVAATLAWVATLSFLRRDEGVKEMRLIFEMSLI